MISQSAEYALRAMVYLVGQPEKLRTVAQIAEATLIPVSYLAKIMQALSRAKLVKSQRGIGGGFQAIHRPEELTVLTVVSAVDPIRRFPECPLGLPSHGRSLCQLHRRLDEAAQLVEEAFQETTLADLLSVPRSSTSRCRFPQPAVKVRKK